eukprot:Lankesteria_metandrocarpae@DN1360_c0_g1_i2.p1
MPSVLSTMALRATLPSVAKTYAQALPATCFNKWTTDSRFMSTRSTIFPRPRFFSKPAICANPSFINNVPAGQQALLQKGPCDFSAEAKHTLKVTEKVHEVSHHLHPIWSDEELNAVELTHHVPIGLTDKAAHYTVQTLRFFYDLLTGYMFGTRDEMCYIRRIIFLETIAGVPGMVGAVVRHLNSLRRMERDYGWIHTLLEEAENERMHLMTAMLLLKKPSFIIKSCVLIAQWGFLCWYTAMYFMSPRFCHRFVGYIEEEAVKTYTGMLQDIDAGNLPLFSSKAHDASMAYWQMPPNSSLRDVILNIRADETHHREVNHTFAEMQKTQVNPFRPGY